MLHGHVLFIRSDIRVTSSPQETKVLSVTPWNGINTHIKISAGPVNLMAKNSNRMIVHEEQEQDKCRMMVYQPDDSTKLEVRLEGDTVWLSQQQMAELFSTARSNIVENIKRIYDECELDVAATCRDLRQVRTEGGREVARTIPHFGMDVIMSIGYRINSKRAMQFRQWVSEISGGKATIPSHVENRGEIILYQPDNSLKLEVKIEEDTVWLTQMQMAELLQTTKQNVNIHINNAFKEGELSTATVKESLTVQIENGREVSRFTKHYNLDVIISVGYRVKSQRGVFFRQWATKILREYLLKGYAINQRFERLEYRVGEHDKKLDFFIKASLPPAQGVFFEGEVFDAYVLISDLICSAKKTIVLIDNYVDKSVLLLLSKRRPDVTATVYTKGISVQLQSDVDMHNAQYAPVIIKTSNRYHDRFLMIDDTVYFIGPSIKDIGKKISAFAKMEIPAEELLKGMRIG